MMWQKSLMTNKLKAAVIYCTNWMYVVYILPHMATTSDYLIINSYFHE